MVNVLNECGVSNHKVTYDAITSLENEKQVVWKTRTSSPLGTLTLTIKGHETLEQLRKEDAEREKQASEQESAESKRVQERAEDIAREERYHAAQNKISIIMPIVAFILGLIIEHFTSICSALFAFFWG